MSVAMQKPVTPSQWDITSGIKKELEHFKYYYHRQSDFWEWLENVKGLNNEELFNEFEKWEDEQN
jgi:hypothetical protein